MLQELHDTAQDPVIGAVDVVHDEQTGTFLGGHPVGRHVDRALVALHLGIRIDLEGEAVQVTHFLKLGGGAVSELPSALPCEVHRDLRLAEPVGSPDAHRGGARAVSLFLLKIGEEEPLQKSRHAVPG